MSVKQIFNTSAELDYPTVLPTLDLDFANSKTLDPRITFTRASGGSYYGADGLIKLAGVNEPRFDHDPVTGESLGFLVEEARTNSFLYSEQLDNAAWRKFDITATANAGLAPDGTTTAELITTASTTAQKYFDPNSEPVLQTSSDYCVSFFVKLISGTGNAAFASISSANGAISPVYASYALRLDNFAESTEGNLPSVRGYTIFPNGWVRMYMVFNTSAQTNAVIQFRFGTNDTVSSYHVWGLQIEKGSFPTSYIPTEGSSRTRAADVASMTGTNFSSWYNQNEGTLFAAQRSDTIQDAYQTSTFILCSSNPNAHFIGMDVTNDYNRFYVYGGGTADTSNYNYLPVTPGTLTKNVLAYANNNVAAARNGGTVVTDSSVAIPIYSYDSATGDFEINRATIGHNLVYGNQKRQHLSRLTYYPKRLTNQQLQTLTS